MRNQLYGLHHRESNCVRCSTRKHTVVWSTAWVIWSDSMCSGGGGTSMLHGPGSMCKDESHVSVSLHGMFVRCSIQRRLLG